jgi:DNA primase large subunit
LEELKLRHVPYEQWGAQLQSVVARLNQDPIVDEVSHFILRLAYCRTEDLRRWLLAHETALMKVRLSFGSNGSSSVLNANALADIVPEARLLTGSEVDEIWPHLCAATPALTISVNIKDARSIYAVPFTIALDLVSTRQVYVHRGQAYIPASKLLHIVTAKFRTQLSRQLVWLSAVPKSSQDLGRTQALVDNLATSAVGSYQQQTGEFAGTSSLTSNTVQAHVKHMPLCMVSLQLGLQADQKLKHWGRLQYGLFLKGAGLSLDDALTYFERQFALSKNFQKEYSYNFRHMYGKEGKRASYPPYSCSKVINSNTPNANDHHGCPYKHSSVSHVTQLLQKMGVAPPQRTGIIALQQSHHYQLACLEHFKVMHPDISSSRGVSMDNVGNHPNAWFQASVSYTHQKNGIKATTAEDLMALDDTQQSTATTTVAISP